MYVYVSLSDAIKVKLIEYNEIVTIVLCMRSFFLLQMSNGER